MIDLAQPMFISSIFVRVACDRDRRKLISIEQTAQKAAQQQSVHESEREAIAAGKQATKDAGKPVESPRFPLYPR